MTALMCFASSAVALFAGWQTDDGPVLILGFWLFLIGFGCLLARSYDTYADIALRPVRHTVEGHLNDDTERPA